MSVGIAGLLLAAAVGLIVGGGSGFLLGLLGGTLKAKFSAVPVTFGHRPCVKQGQVWMDREGHIGVVTGWSGDNEVDIECPDGFSLGGRPFPTLEPTHYRAKREAIRGLCTLVRDENGNEPEVTRLGPGGQDGDLTLIPREPLRLVESEKKPSRQVVELK
jgi:hypothetical protein